MRWSQRILQSENDKKSLINFVILFFVILLFFHIRYGLGMLNPVETAWLMKYDWAVQYMGWYFYRFEPWTFPIGQIDNLFYPLGTNIGFTDMAFTAIPLKLLSPFLPEQFQYHGLWFFLNFLLMAFFSIRLLNRLGVRGAAQFFAALIITFSPTFLYRTIHIVLISHWVIIANLWIYFLDPKEISWKKILGYQFILFIVGGLICPYFPLINGGFLFILALKFCFIDKVLPIKYGVPYVALSAAVMIGLWSLIGYFSFSSIYIADAYGQYSWNLSSFFNPFTYDRNEDWFTHNLSSFLPAHELLRWEQYESFTYFGLGVLILSGFVILVIILHASTRKIVIDLFKNRSIILLFILTLFLTLFAISNVVTYNDKILFTYPMPAFTKVLTDTFRASARVIWVFYYIWFFFIFFISVKFFKKSSYLLGGLILICIIQFADIRPMIFNKKLVYEPYKMKISEPEWERIIKSADKLLFLPPLQTNYLTHDDWQYFSWLGAKNRKPVNLGHVARVDFAGSQKFAGEMFTSIAQRKMDSTAIYVTLPKLYSQFLGNYAGKNIDVIMLNGYMVIATTNHKYTYLKEIFADIRKNNDQKFITEHFYLSKPQPYTRVITNDSLIRSNMYEVTLGINSVVLRGWSFRDDNQNDEIDSVRLLLKGPSNKILSFHTDSIATPDVAEYFHNPKLTGSGFQTVIDATHLENGNYQLGVEFNYHGNNLPPIVKSRWTDTFVQIMFPVSPSPLQWDERTDEIKSDASGPVVTNDGFRIDGWAFPIKKIKNSEMYLTLSSSNAKLAFKAISGDRPDVVTFFNDPSVIHSGFSVLFDPLTLAPGRYTIGILFKDPASNRYYQKNTATTFEISPHQKLMTAFSSPARVDDLPLTTENATGFVDNISDKSVFYQVEGWAFVSNVDDSNSKISLILKSSTMQLKVDCEKHYRPDLKDAFHHSFKTDSSGFVVKLKKDDFEKGEYELFVLVENATSSYVKSLNQRITF